MDSPIVGLAKSNSEFREMIKYSEIKSKFMIQNFTFCYRKNLAVRITQMLTTQVNVTIKSNDRYTKMNTELYNYP